MGDATVTLRAPMSSAIPFFFPFAFFGLMSFNGRIAASNGHGAFIAFAVLSLVGFVFSVLPRRIAITNGELVISGALGVKRAAVRDVQRVVLVARPRPKGGTDRSLAFELTEGRKLELSFPVDAKPPVGFAAVLQVIAEQASAVTFDDGSNRLRLGALDWG